MSAAEGAAPLVTGWEADAPAGDTLCVLSCSTGALSAPIRARRWAVGCCVATIWSGPAGFANNATLLRPLDGAGLDEVLSALDGFFGFDGDDRAGDVILFSAWPTPNLRPHGWTLVGHPPLHLLPAGRVASEPPAEPRVEPVRDAEGLRAWEAVVVAGNPMPQLLPLLPGAVYDERVLGDDRLRFWGGRVDGQAVSVAAAFVAAGINDVVFVVTLPEGRGRGYGAALTWRAAP